MLLWTGLISVRVEGFTPKITPGKHSKPFSKSKMKLRLWETTKMSILDRERERREMCVCMYVYMYNE